MRPRGSRRAACLCERGRAEGTQPFSSLPALQVLVTVVLLLRLWLLPVPVPVLFLQLLLQPVFQTQLVLRQPVQVRP